MIFKYYTPFKHIQKNITSKFMPHFCNTYAVSSLISYRYVPEIMHVSNVYESLTTYTHIIRRVTFPVNLNTTKSTSMVQMYGLTEAQDSGTMVILIISIVVTHVLSLQTLHFLPPE